jgi:uncharacterized protein (DUF924 family)
MAVKGAPQMIFCPLTARLSAPAAVLSAALAGQGPAGAAEALHSRAEAGAVVGFWREAGPDRWFAKDAAFDRRFRDRFLALHEAAARGELDGWAADSAGALALLILLDQYPRNAFRGAPRMYATDEKARTIADLAVARGYDLETPPALRLFFYLPWGHSESLADQDRCVQLVAERLGEPSLSRAKHHREIIRRFGRFPHRNAILDREPTAEELSYLAAGGYMG